MSDQNSTHDDDETVNEAPTRESLVIPFLGMIAMGLCVMAVMTNPALLIALGALAVAGYAWTTRNNEPVVKGLIIMLSPLLGELGIEAAGGVHAAGGMMIPMLMISIPVGIAVMRRKNPND